MKRISNLFTWKLFLLEFTFTTIYIELWFNHLLGYVYFIDGYKNQLRKMFKCEPSNDFGIAFTN